MAYNTVSELRDFGRFTTLSDDALQRCLDMAYAEIERLGFIPFSEWKDLELFYAAHFAALTERQATDKSIGDLSVSYADVAEAGLRETTFGREVERRIQAIRGSRVRVL